MGREFRDFIARGNVLDLAVAVIIGAAFGKIVESLVNDIIMPPIGLLLGKVDFSNLYINLSSGTFPSLAEAKQAGAATLNYGVFINVLIEFLILAFVVFLIVRTVNQMNRKPQTAPTTKDCPYCFSPISLQATRCPNCTSPLTS